MKTSSDTEELLLSHGSRLHASCRRGGDDVAYLGDRSSRSIQRKLGRGGNRGEDISA